MRVVWRWLAPCALGVLGGLAMFLLASRLLDGGTRSWLIQAGAALGALLVASLVGLLLSPKPLSPWPARAFGLTAAPIILAPLGLGLWLVDIGHHGRVSLEQVANARAILVGGGIGRIDPTGTVLLLIIGCVVAAPLAVLMVSHQVPCPGVKACRDD